MPEEEESPSPTEGKTSEEVNPDAGPKSKPGPQGSAPPAPGEGPTPQQPGPTQT